MSQFLKDLRNFANSIRTFFTLYVLMYLVPQLIPFSLFYVFQSHFFLNEKDINYPVLIIISVYAIFIISWNLFFLLYFTKERTQYPHLYGRYFVTGFDIITDTDSKAETFGEPKEIKEDETSSNPKEQSIN